METNPDLSVLSGYRREVNMTTRLVSRADKETTFKIVHWY